PPQGHEAHLAARRNSDPLDRNGTAHGPGRRNEDRGARDHRPHHQALPAFNPRGGLHDRERGRGLSRHPGGRRHQGDPWHDPEVDFHRAAIARHSADDISTNTSYDPPWKIMSIARRDWAAV